MGKRKRQLDKKEAEMYIPDFTRSNEVMNDDIHALNKEIDPYAHSGTNDSRIVNNVKRELRFSKNEAFIPSSNQRKAMKLAQEFEEHLKDHAQYFQTLTRSENFDTNKLNDKSSKGKNSTNEQHFNSSLNESQSKRKKLNDNNEEDQDVSTTDTNKINPNDIHHLCLRGLGKKVTEKEFRKMMNDIPFLNLKMHTGKSKITGFVVIGDKALQNAKDALQDKKLYGKKLQIWEKMSKTNYTGTTRYIYVGNLPPGTNAGMIGGHLLICGKIKKITMIPKKSCCFIRFKHRESVEKALAYNNTFFNGFYLRISEEKNMNDMILDRFDENGTDKNIDLDVFDSDLEDD